MRIPLGDFGNRVAQTVPGVRAPANMDGGQAEALGRIGQQTQQIAGSMLEEQRLEAKRQQEIARREAERQRDIEQRTKAGLIRTTTQNDVADLLDEVRRGVADGTVPKDKAEEVWRERAAVLLKGRTEGLMPEYAGVLQADFEGLSRRGASGVRDAVFKRGQEDTKANLLQLGEQYQRQALRDRSAATAEYFAHIDALGPQAGLGPDDMQKLKQGFTEQTTYTEAFAMAGAAKNDLGAIKKAREELTTERYASLDPQRRAQLDAQLMGYETHILQRREIEAARAQREQEARMRRAEAAFTSAQARMDAGLFDSPEQVAATTQALSGTPFLDTYQTLQKSVREVGGFASMPVAHQRAELDQVNAQIATQGASEALLKRRDSLQKILGAAQQDIGSDPLRAALERGVIRNIPPIDMSSVEGALRSIGARLETAEVVRGWSGQSTSPLTADEAQQFGRLIGALPPAQRSTRLADLAQVLGPQASAGLAKQIDPQDRPLALALALSGSKTNFGRHTSELVLKGQQAIKDKVIKVEQGAEHGWRAEITKRIGDAFPSEEHRQAIVDTAFYIRAGMAAEGGHRNELENAVRLAIGGSLVEHNGGRIPLPSSVTEELFRQRLRSISTAELQQQAPDGRVRAGSAEIPLEQFVASLPGARLVYAGRGRYGVQAGGSIVTTTGGKPIVIGVGDAR